MLKPPDVPGPGEDAGPGNILPEAESGPIPEGEMVGEDLRADWRRKTLEMEPVEQSEPDDHSDEPMRKTGTENPVVVVSASTQDSTEQRLDSHARKLQREDRYDPAQDSAGPQPDQS